MNLPFTVNNRANSVRAHALPTLALPCILGLDFLGLFDMIVNFSRKEWHFKDEPSVVYRFEKQPVDPVFRVNTSFENSASRKSDNHVEPTHSKLEDRKSDDVQEITLPAKTISVRKETRSIVEV